MHRPFLALVTCLVIIAFGATTNAAAGSPLPSALYGASLQPSATGVVTATTLNVRAGASTTASILAKLKAGDTVDIVGRNADATWLAIRLKDGRQGWVSAQLVRPNIPLQQIPLAAQPTAATSTAGSSGIPANAVAAQLVSVTDGDTIAVTIAGRPDTVRYIGIDTPERNQPGFAAASDANRALLGAGTLYLVTDTSERDRYDRLLRYVYTVDGKMVNRELVAQGWAQPVEYPPDTRYAAEFRGLASQAAKARRGFWSGAAADGAMPYALTSSSANIRKGPGKGFAVATTVPAATPLTVYGRTPAGDWLQVRAPDLKGGWVAAGLVTLNIAVAQVGLAQDIPAAPAASQSGGTRGVVPQPPATTGGAAVQIMQLNGTLDDETVVIQNMGAGAVDLGGWSIQSYSGNTCRPVDDQVFTFPGGYQLGPGASVRVHSGPGAFGNPPGDLLWTTKNIWNNGGDRADLRDAGGQVVSISAYGGCR